MHIKIAHFTAKILGSKRLCAPVPARWLWSNLRRVFPTAAAAVIMLDHVHLVVESDDFGATKNRLAKLLARFSNSFRLGHCWDSVHVQPCANFPILRRTLCYPSRNPCREGYVGDPLKWPWSTHRDVVGAVADPWISAERLAPIFRRPAHDFARWFHRYASTDKDSGIFATPFPNPAAPTLVPKRTLPEIARAAAAATRGQPADIQRRGDARVAFVQLAWAQGWRQRVVLAEAIDTSSESVRLITHSPRPALLEAAALCLGDERLIEYEVPERFRIFDLAAPNLENLQVRGL